MKIGQLDVGDWIPVLLKSYVKNHPLAFPSEMPASASQFSIAERRTFKRLFSDERLKSLYSHLDQFDLDAGEWAEFISLAGKALEEVESGWIDEFKYENTISASLGLAESADSLLYWISHYLLLDDYQSEEVIGLIDDYDFTEKLHKIVSLTCSRIERVHDQVSEAEDKLRSQIDSMLVGAPLNSEEWSEALKKNYKRLSVKIEKLQLKKRDIFFPPRISRQPAIEGEKCSRWFLKKFYHYLFTSDEFEDREHAPTRKRAHIKPTATTFPWISGDHAVLFADVVCESEEFYRSGMRHKGSYDSCHLSEPSMATDIEREVKNRLAIK